VQPREEIREPLVDVVDVKGGNLHEGQKALEPSLSAHRQ
jgi:hypothetical protein